jgi:hypothetical protein
MTKSNMKTGIIAGALVFSALVFACDNDWMGNLIDKANPPSNTTILFNWNDGRVPPEETVIGEKGAPLGEKMPVIEEGDRLSFLGWNTRPDGDGKAFTAATPVIADTSLFAVWKNEADAPNNVSE